MILEKRCEFVKIKDEFQESHHRCQGFADPQALDSPGQMGADHERKITPKPGTWRLNKLLCFVMDNLTMVGAVGEEGHKHCGPYNKLSQGLSRLQTSHCPGVPLHRDERINAPNSGRWSIAQLAECRGLTMKGSTSPVNSWRRLVYLWQEK